mgnify:CR=1 FL=1
MGRTSDIAIEPPTAAGPGIVRAVEDRSYLGFIAAALASVLFGGLVFAVWIPLTMSGTVGGAGRLAWMVQAHGWVQVQGWAGLFVAGMAIRLIPRFAGRRPVPRRVTIPLLAVLAVPVVLRIALQTTARGGTADVVAMAIGVTTAAGAIGVAAVLAVTLTFDWLEMVSGEVIGPPVGRDQLNARSPGTSGYAKLVFPALPPKLDQPGLARDRTFTWPSEQETSRAVATIVVVAISAARAAAANGRAARDIKGLLRGGGGIGVAQ